MRRIWARHSDVVRYFYATWSCWTNLRLFSSHHDWLCELAIDCFLVGCFENSLPEVTVVLKAVVAKIDGSIKEDTLPSLHKIKHESSIPERKNLSKEKEKEGLQSKKVFSSGFQVFHGATCGRSA